MEKKETVKFPNCGEKFTKKGFIYHERKCNEIYAIKDILIQRYLECKSCEILHKEFDIGINAIRKYLKMWGLTLKETTTLKPINTDGRGIKIEFNEDYFDEMGSKQYWLIGLLAADGNVNKNNNQFSISQSGENGKKLIDYIRNELNIKNQVKPRKTNGQPAYGISLSSKKIQNVLKEYNIVPNKTYIYTFPENIPERYLSSFIAGYIEGDGCICKTKTSTSDCYMSISFVGTEQFIKRCRELIPITGSIIQRKKSPTTFELSWAGLKAVELGEWLYSDEDIYHSYKYEKYIQASKLYKESEYYKRLIMRNTLLDQFENGHINTYTEVAEQYEIDKKLIKRWIYNAYVSSKVTRDYKYLRGT